MTNAELDRAQALITSIPDYPEPGVNFRDISPLLADGPAFTAVTEALIAPFLGRFDFVGGLEARGFLFAGAIAAMTGAGILPIR
ncbi:adenine phosphoribosyltransferase, partial [Mycobacterium tuberculosis]|nr:adenine phosphoribosyltransferase [Mycobacterium tuberculosis]